MSHACPKNGCPKSVPDNQLACRAHWYKVTKPTRDWVWAAYLAGQGSPDHVAAMSKAISEMNA